MKKTFLVVLIAFLSSASTSFACDAKGTTTFSTSIGQKACQTVFSFINLDLSILSPRASIADFNVAGPQTTCCCKKAMAPDDDTQKALVPPTNEQKSMATEDGQKIISAANKQETVESKDKEETIIPVSNKQESKQSCVNPQDKTSLFRIDLFHRFKMKIL